MKSLLLALLLIPVSNFLAKEAQINSLELTKDCAYNIAGVLSNNVESLKGIDIEFDVIIEWQKERKGLLFLKNVNAEISLEDERLFNNPLYTFLMIHAKDIALQKLYHEFAISKQLIDASGALLTLRYESKVWFFKELYIKQIK